MTGLPELHESPFPLAPAAVRDYLYTLQRLDGYLHHTVNTRLALDILVLRLPHTAAALDSSSPLP